MSNRWFCISSIDYCNDNVFFDQYIGYQTKLKNGNFVIKILSEKKPDIPETVYFVTQEYVINIPDSDVEPGNITCNELIKYKEPII